MILDLLTRICIILNTSSCFRQTSNLDVFKKAAKIGMEHRRWLIDVINGGGSVIFSNLKLVRLLFQQVRYLCTIIYTPINHFFLHLICFSLNLCRPVLFNYFEFYVNDRLQNTGLLLVYLLEIRELLVKDLALRPKFTANCYAFIPPSKTPF